jgi:hypothetical protein
MTRLGLRLFLTFVTCVGVGVGGCDSQPLTDPNPVKPKVGGLDGGPAVGYDGAFVGSTDGSFDQSFDGAWSDRAVIDSSEIDPCQCQVGSDGALRMSWECFCANDGCGQPESGWCGSGGEWTASCGGINVYTLPSIGELELFVYGPDGRQIGVKLVAEAGTPFVCPTDSTQRSNVVSAGTIPGSECAPISCTCNDDRTFTCPATDAGTSPVPDGGLPLAPPP